MTTSLQKKQKDAFLRMLAFNSDADLDIETNPSDDRLGSNWKVLIYDRFGRDVISPILTLPELRKMGVTLHMLVDSSREEIPDVPAIYFVTPNEQNIQRVVTDCSKSLYSSLYLNFASPVPRSLLESLAEGTVAADSVQMITKVVDQYLNFVCLEPQLFSLNHKESYKALNDVNQTDASIENTMTCIVQGLFSVCATMGEVPVIRCRQSEGPSRMIAQQLHDMLKDHLSTRANVFSESSSFQRPVLVIMDRSEDIAAALHHPSTYQALVDDVIGIHMNRVKIKSTTKASDATTKQTDRTYDLNVTADSFFENHAYDLFPVAIDANEKEMRLVTKQEEDIKSKTGSVNNIAGEGTKDMSAVLDSLQPLLEKKKLLEIHTNIFQGAFEVVTSRDIPDYSMMEQKLIDGSHLDRDEVMQLISQGKGTLADKLRLLMIYYLSASEDVDVSAVEKCFFDTLGTTSEDKDTFNNAWQYLRKHSSFQKRASVGGMINTSMSNSTDPSPPGSSSSSRLGNWAGQFAGHAQGFLAQAAASVKNFLPENKKLQVTRIVDAICEVKDNTENDTFMYLDPKTKSNSRIRKPFRQAVVFMVGGGNYNEYQNLQAYAKAQQEPRNIIYGCTELLNPESFLNQLSTIHS